jgi:Winged helix-turn helix
VGDDHDDEQGAAAGARANAALVGEVATAEAALLLGLSERQVWRLRTGYERDGPAAVVHGNRGRASARRRDPALTERILTVARTTYDGADDCYLAELSG